jgi:hypothetical protein
VQRVQKCRAQRVQKETRPGINAADSRTPKSPTSGPNNSGIGQLNQAAIHAAGSLKLKNPTSGPNNALAIVPLAEAFNFFKALAENSAEKFETRGKDLRPAGGPSFPSAAA